MQNYDSIENLVRSADDRGLRISDVVVEWQAVEMACTRQELYSRMAGNWEIMKAAAAEGMRADIRSASGLSGGDARRLQKAFEEGRTFGGGILTNVIIKSMAVAEVNACMGKIVAAPTAGSCGILPAVLLTAMEERKLQEEKIIDGLFTAAGIGLVIARRAGISGAEGGCQAECGSASAMAAGALVEILGGTPRMVANACAISLKNILGLVCDPVAGLVEVPCIKRNAMGAANALVAADMAVAGIDSVIPADEVIGAMRSVGELMAVSLKETARGGLAATDTGKKLAGRISEDV